MKWVPYTVLWGFVIRSARRSLSLKQSDLGTVLGIGASGVAKIESGTVSPTLLQIALLADLLARDRPCRQSELSKRVERLRKRCTDQKVEVRMCRLPVGKSRIPEECIHGWKLDDLLLGLGLND
jgi:transcriptional regulator with XRE-family HTH domain